VVLYSGFLFYWFKF